MRHGRLALLLVTAAAAHPGSAHAAVTFGADLRIAPNTSTGCYRTTTLAQTSLPLRSAAAPSDGVVVRWRLRGDGPPLPLRVLHPTGDGRYEGVGTSATENVRSTDDINRVHTFETRLPIKRGDVLGIDLPADDPRSLDHDAMLWAFFTPVGGWTTPPVPWAELRTWTPKLEDGTTRVPGEDPWTQCLDRTPMILLINADIEPDADHDGYGDETQDGCPANAYDQQPPCDASAPAPADPAATASETTTAPAPAKPRARAERRRRARPRTRHARSGRARRSSAR